MSLRAKLVLSFAALLLLVIAGFGVVASSSVDRILIGQTDRVLLGIKERISELGAGGPFGGLEGPPFTGEDAFLRRDVAELWIDQEGEVVLARPSGFADDPDPLPDISQLQDDGEPATIPSVDDSMQYRALEVSRSDGLRVVVAFSLNDVESAQETLIGVLLLSGLGVLLVGTVATWATVNRAMRPVDEMVDTAEAIAAGNLTKRVVQTDPGTELGRLGISLNEMLHTIEVALAHERESLARLRRFVADASHELRTPITAISGYAELRRQGGLSTREDEDRAWRRIEAESHRMSNLVEDLVILTRLGQVQTLEFEEVDLSSVARDALADHAAIDPEHPATFEGPESLYVEADRERLHQVVSNLLSNARTHTPPGTAVRLSVRQRGADAELVVEDDGPGIPPSAMDHVFDRFYRADESRSRASGGSGLGLSIVKAIVEAHGGDITVANDPGARFTVTLPVSPR